jgi:hypothetical protein
MSVAERNQTMTGPGVTEQQMVEALRSLPRARWPEVLAFIDSLRGQQSPSGPILTARDLAQSPLVGIWADRNDLGDSREFARWLREQAGRRDLQGGPSLGRVALNLDASGNRE